MRALLLSLVVGLTVLSTFAAPATQPGAVTLTGGHDTDLQDRGRPVALVAAGLNVPPEVFRKAFSKVHPAGPGRGPTEDEARRNKDALLGDLAKYGVTNDRLDEVSNYYRYRRESGELWKHRDAKLTAVVTDGAVTEIKIDDAGVGYTTPPVVSVAGFDDLKIEVKLHFGTDLPTNGSIESVQIVK